LLSSFLEEDYVTREDLRAFAEKEGIPLRQLQIPEDGEILKL
jgi:hypothetical protein